MSIIYIAETYNRKDFVAKIIERFRSQIEWADSIFIKSNIVSSEPYPTTTHPKLLAASLENLSEKEDYTTIKI